MLGISLVGFTAANLKSQEIEASTLSFNDIARFVAGKPLSPTSRLRPLLNQLSVQEHYHETAALSKKWEESRLAAIRQWALTDIQPQIPQPATVKYMFGGPDFIHVATIFPGAPEYILVGLEPLGSIPNFLSMTEEELNTFLDHLNHTLRSISRRNFFITTEMREDFGKNGVDGVFPVLLYFAALNGHQVIDASYVKLDSQGEPVVSDQAGATGIWLRLFDEGGGYNEQNLYYFLTDLSNNGFRGGSSFHQFLSARPHSIGYLKAASYLMHTENFTNIRNFLVTDCQFILQDASGIPAEFLSLYYQLTFYGNYVGPIDMFSEYDQPWLHEAYRSGAARTLPFGTGYRMRDDESIQLFGTRKE